MSPKSSSADSSSAPPCPACQAIPLNNEDKFCRRCGCRLCLECRHCHNSIRLLDRFCPTCGTRRLIIFDQIRRVFMVNFPLITATGLAVVLGGAWLLLRAKLQRRL